MLLVSSSISYQWLLQKHHQAQQQQRIEVIQALAAVRAKLEAEINAAMHLTEGLYSYIAINGDIDKNSFNKMAQRLILNSSHILNISLAPNFVLKYIYPLQGNEKAIGLKFKEHHQQLSAVLDARYSRHTILAGPLQLVQGGTGLIARTPIFIASDSSDPRDHYWGMASIVMDWNSVKAAAGLDNEQSNIDIAIKGRDGLGDQGDTFYGKPELFTQQSIFSTVYLVTGQWKLAASPAQGWRADHGIDVLQHPALLGLNVLMTLMTYLLFYQIQRHQQQMRQMHSRYQGKLYFLATLEQDLAAATANLGHYLHGSEACYRQSNSNNIQYIYPMASTDILQSFKNLQQNISLICKLESDSLEVNIQSVCLNSLFSALQQEPQSLADNTDIALITQAHDLVVSSDTQLLAVIIKSLLEISRFNSGSGSIKLSATDGIGATQVDICATGDDDRHRDYSDKIHAIFEHSSPHRDNLHKHVDLTRSLVKLHRIEGKHSDHQPMAQQSVLGKISFDLYIVKRLCQLLDIEIELSAYDKQDCCFRLTIAH